MRISTFVLLFVLLFLPAISFAVPAPRDIFFFINQERGANGLPALSINESLNKAAELKVKNLASRGAIEHTSDVNGLWWPLKSANYDYSYAGENLAVGIENSEEMVSSWMLSPSHRANILNSKYTEMGVAVETGYFEGDREPFVVLYTATPKSSSSVVLGASTASTASEKAEIERLQAIIEYLTRYILILQSLR